MRDTARGSCAPDVFPIAVKLPIAVTGQCCLEVDPVFCSDGGCRYVVASGDDVVHSQTLSLYEQVAHLIAQADTAVRRGVDLLARLTLRRASEPSGQTYHALAGLHDARDQIDNALDNGAPF